jgi:7-cyano-7-deazaguanine synthase
MLHHIVKARRWEVKALSLFYGQKHNKELECARWQAEQLGVPWQLLDISAIFQDISTPLLTGEGIPDTPYSAQTDGKNPVPTYVPYRNGILLSIATARAYASGCSTVAYAAHADDALGSAYPDCSSFFIEKQQEAIQIGTAGAVKTLYAPFADLTKAEIVKKGVELGVDFSRTWSCYNGNDKPCGTCATCRDRAAALEANGMKNDWREDEYDA